MGRSELIRANDDITIASTGQAMSLVCALRGVNYSGVSR